MLFKIITICSIIYLANAKNQTCPTYLRELANQQTLFIYCITTNSVPVTMCLRCKNHHDGVLQAYDLLSANCENIYFDKDRINLVASTEMLLTGLWTKAYCDDCFNNNNSFVFYEKNQVFNDCFQKYKKNPCEKCKSQYMDLNTFYINLDQHNNGEVCFDLQDSMNRTRNMWSKELHCCRRDYNVTLFTIALGIILSLPLLFYCSTYLITKRQERNHDVLNDEEPITSLPSTSNRANNLNNINNPTPTVSNNHASSSSGNTANSSSISKPSNKHNFNILNEDSESSDDEIALKTKDKLK
ncbi:osteopetrosis-associated transmembrane protein 1 [Lucilia sericata]|uniref:osteopetrosis-associated transmembrane protein 1 n=1 Tax=Lucilia sericata TaxID=13632 RepID=UPI0018A80235|nr:osteopetrosis-associated transmembrane protein 1 [Lucilia sericata]